jgi:hypothetical protein
MSEIHPKQKKAILKAMQGLSDKGLATEIFVIFGCRRIPGEANKIQTLFIGSVNDVGDLAALETAIQTILVENPSIVPIFEIAVDEALKKITPPPPGDHPPS